MKRKAKSYVSLESASDVIQIRKKPQNELEIENLVLRDMRKKILNDEMNQLNFYDIVQPNQDDVITTLKEIKKAPIKLHQKVRRSDLEQRLRDRLAKEPGNKLLLQEIYEYLEEDGQGKLLLKKMHQEEQFKGNEHYKVESDEQQVANLEVWHKRVKKRMKEEKEKQRLREEKEKEEQEKARIARLQMAQRTQTIANFRRVGLAMRDLARPGTIVQSQQQESEKGESSLFRQKLLGTLAKATMKKKIELLNQDSNLTKQLDKYMQQGATLTQLELLQIEQARAKQEQEKESGALIFDYTVEGLKNSLHTLIKMQLIQFQNAIDRALFYEKQTNQILFQINRKLERQRQTVIKNEKDLQQLRMENHDIHKKLRDIQGVIKELNEELRQVTTTPKKPQPSLTNINSNNRNPSTHIDNYMLIATKQNELEDHIDLMRDSYSKYQQQMKYNSVQIEKLENENGKLNKNNKALSKSIQGFLLELLKIGLDCRKQGLCWIVKQVWESGENVFESNFPPYLDSRAREFILIKSKKVNELNDLFKKGHQLFSNYQGASIDIGNNSILTLLGKNHFSLIDSQDIKLQSLQERKKQKNEELSLLFQGMSEDEKKYIDGTITHILTSKQTQNDIIYSEASKKINKMFKSQQEFYTNEQSITQLSEVNYDQKDKLIKEYQNIQREIQIKEQEFKKFEETELLRLIKEIEYRKYLQRFNVEALQVLAALFGYQRAERELIKYGMIHKMLGNNNNNNNNNNQQQN